MPAPGDTHPTGVAAENFDTASEESTSAIYARDSILRDGLEVVATPGIDIDSSCESLDATSGSFRPSRISSSW